MIRIPPKHWHYETWVCSIVGHACPAAEVGALTAADAALGVEMPDGVRFVRCLRCDMWLHLADPATPKWPVMPALSEMDLPRRGTPLRQAIVLRVISVIKALHAVAFGLLALLLIGIRARIGKIREWAENLANVLHNSAGSHLILDRWLSRIAHLSNGELAVMLVFALVYCAIEGVEAWALWRERRWGEYLTVVATAGFVPLEVYELVDRVTLVKVVALAVNVAIVVWLIRAKHLFGVRGGERTLHESVDWPAILGAETPATGKTATPRA